MSRCTDKPWSTLLHHCSYRWEAEPLEISWKTKTILAPVKAVIYDSNPKHFLSNSESISSRSASFLFCVCTERKSLVFIHSPHSVNRKQTECLGLSRQPRYVKYCHFSRVSTKHLGIVRQSSCSGTGTLCVTHVTLKEHWREECICLAVEFKCQQRFSRIRGYTFKLLFKLKRFTQPDKTIKVVNDF